MLLRGSSSALEMLGYQLKIQFLSIYQVVFLQCKNQCSEGWTHPLRGRSVWTKRVRTDCPSHCLSNMVLGGKKGWVHENLRPFSLVLWFYLCLLFLLPTTSSVPEHPQDLKKYRMQDHGSSEPSRSKSPPRPTPSLLLDMRFQQRHWKLPGAAETGASRPPTWIVTATIPGVIKQCRNSTKREKIVCWHRKPTLKIWTWIS